MARSQETHPDCPGEVYPEFQHLRGMNHPSPLERLFTVMEPHTNPLCTSLGMGDSNTSLSSHATFTTAQSRPSSRGSDLQLTGSSDATLTRMRAVGEPFRRPEIQEVRRGVVGEPVETGWVGLLEMEVELGDVRPSHRPGTPFKWEPEQQREQGSDQDSDMWSGCSREEMRRTGIREWEESSLEAVVAVLEAGGEWPPRSPVGEAFSVDGEGPAVMVHDGGMAAGGGVARIVRLAEDEEPAYDGRQKEDSHRANRRAARTERSNRRSQGPAGCWEFWAGGLRTQWSDRGR